MKGFFRAHATLTVLIRWANADSGPDLPDEASTAAGDCV